MSRISDVLKNKNRIEKSQRARRKEELTNLKSQASFKASLSDEMKYIDSLLDSDEVDSITIKVPEKLITKFGEAIYSEELSGYDISQVPGEPDLFNVRYKAI